MKKLLEFQKYMREQLGNLFIGNPKDLIFVSSMYATEAYIAGMRKEEEHIGSRQWENEVWRDIIKEEAKLAELKDCSTCEGTGVRYVPNGPDDTDAEECDCITQ